MRKQTGLSQETLKVIACLTMLLDHIGAVLVPGWTLRIIGRMAFPIYCFLLAEGVHYTRDPKRYALRLAIGAALSEIPFDLALFGGLTWQHQSVMVTMLLGLGALEAMKRLDRSRIPAVLLCYLAAEWLRTDYGGPGVLLIVLFGLTRDLPRRGLYLLAGMTLLILALMPGARVSFFGTGLRIPIELYALLALIPISLYSGRKATRGKAVQLAFYLFYPAHLWVLYRIASALG